MHSLSREKAAHPSCHARPGFTLPTADGPHKCLQLRVRPSCFKRSKKQSPDQPAGFSRPVEPVLGHVRSLARAGFLAMPPRVYRSRRTGSSRSQTGFARRCCSMTIDSSLELEEYFEDMFNHMALNCLICGRMILNHRELRHHIMHPHLQYSTVMYQ